MARHKLTDVQWECIADLFPKPKTTGRPPTGCRMVFDAILWILRTGSPWRDLPEEYGKQIEIVTKPTQATEHQALACHCQACNKTHVAGVPEEVRKAGLCGPELPTDNKAQNLAKRFVDHGASYLKFLTTPGLEPTNNLAEQAIRFVVIDRKVTQGSKSESGQRWLERIWTLTATCAQTGQSLLEVIRGCVTAHFQGDLPPPLLPAT